MTQPTMLSPAVLPILHCDDLKGNPLVNGRLYTYIAGTSTPASTYENEYGTALNTNPIVLDMRGECRLWLKDGMKYKLVLKDRYDNPIWEIDNVNSLLKFDIEEGDNCIAVSYDIVDGVKVLRISIKPHSIGREQLKNFHNLVPDSRYLQFKDFGGKVVVSLCDGLQAWLESEGYEA